MRIALIGVGSLGTIIGALTAKNGGDITLVDTNKSHVQALNKNGATVKGKLQLDNIPVKAITPSQLGGIYDIIIILTKQTFNDSVKEQIKNHIDSNSVICTLQNGIPEQYWSEAFGKDRVVGGAVGWGASWLEPGVSELTSDTSSMRYDIGEQDGSITDRIKEIQKILSLSGETIIVDNLMGIRWAKVIQNATLSGMSAALGATYAQILDNDKANECAAHVGNELIQIVKSLKVDLVELVDGWSFYSLEFNNKIELEESKKWLIDYFKPHRLLKASMLQDMEKGIKSEIDYIVGIGSDLGRELNIDTPISDTIVEIVKDFENGKIDMPTMEMLDRFNLPVLD